VVVTADADAVLRILDRFRAGWEALDPEVVLECFEASPTTTVIGTDATEYWRGFDALAAPFRAMTAAFQAPRYTWALPPRIEVAGEAAWADGVLDTTLVTEAGEVRAEMRSTWVLRRSQGDWKVVQAHFSVAPEEPVAEY
jgi:ketosteroid isomerase-like protein